jgi:hypothetical protein
MSDSLIVLSYDAEATSFLLGEKATIVIGYISPTSIRPAAPIATSYSLIVMSFEVEAIMFL